MTQKRVVVVVNKWWECDPVVNVLLNDNARPKTELGWPDPLHHPRKRPDQKNLPKDNPSPVPRAIFNLKNITAEVWCISDLLEDYPDLPTKPNYQSSSELKAQRLPRVFTGAAVDFVVAVGTAGYPSPYSENGSVVVGSKIFIHNGHPNGENPISNWKDGPFDQLIDSKIGQDTFNAITIIETSPKPTVLDCFMIPPLNPTGNGRLIARYDHVALGSVNVTDYTEYTQKDDETLKTFTDKYNISTARSLETTHGLIRVQSDAPFIFVSGITDRVGHFGEEVGPRTYAQNTSAAHNAGVVVAWMLPKIDLMLA
jgi:hypothetical protein